jgi:hypothetical protein
LSYLTCGGEPATNGLFRFDGDRWNMVGTVEGYPSNHISLPGNYHAVAHSEFAGSGFHGFSIINGRTGEIADAIDLSREFVRDEEGHAISFNQTFPNGMLYIGGKICVASSNLDEISGDPGATSYNPGTVSCFDLAPDGTIAHDDGVAYITSGVNPTGMVLMDEVLVRGIQRFAVLSSNSYDRDGNLNAALDIFSYPGMDRRAIIITAKDGSPVTAQIGPALAITRSGAILVGIQAPFNALYGADPDSGEIVFRRPIEGVANFISSINALGDLAALSDFDGKAMFLDTSPNGWADVLETPLPGMAGPALVYGGHLYQSVSTGEIWMINLEGLQ